MTIGERIKTLRKSNDMTQEDLAKKIDVSRQAVASWEADRTLPSVKNAYAMADVFDCDINDIAGEDMQERRKVRNDEEFLLLENFRKADKETQRMVLRMLKYSNVVVKYESNEA